MTDQPIILHCPTCKKTIRWNKRFPYRPFCSERCRLIDLGEWATENFKIADEPNTENNKE